MVKVKQLACMIHHKIKASHRVLTFHSLQYAVLQVCSLLQNNQILQMLFSMKLGLPDIALKTEQHISMENCT